MENDAFKSAWNNEGAAPKNNADLQQMLSEKSHPVLKPIRRQLIFETLAFMVFLFVYYDFFDGDQKPLYANLALVAAVFSVLGHHLTGYFWIRRRSGGDQLKVMLENELTKIRHFANVSVTLRAVVAACLLMYFSSVITFDTSKYLMLAAVIAIFGFQIYLTARMWRGRSRRIQDTIAQLS